MPGCKCKVSFVLEKQKTFLRLLCIIGKKGDQGDIVVSVTCKISGFHTVGTVHMIKPLLVKVVFSVIQIEVDAMVRFIGEAVVGIVADDVEEIEVSVTDHIGYIVVIGIEE